MTRYVISIILDGQERVRRAVYADSPMEVCKMNIFSDTEIDLVTGKAEEGTDVFVIVEERAR